jgi:hypothetical protein
MMLLSSVDLTHVLDFLIHFLNKAVKYTVNKYQPYSDYTQIHIFVLNALDFIMTIALSQFPTSAWFPIIYENKPYMCAQPKPMMQALYQNRSFSKLIMSVLLHSFHQNVRAAFEECLKLICNLYSPPLDQDFYQQTDVIENPRIHFLNILLDQLPAGETYRYIDCENYFNFLNLLLRDSKSKHFKSCF